MIESEIEKKLYDAVKCDNVKSFREIVEQDFKFLTLCYGRFPILSLCYLFDSQKIVREYEAKLMNINKFNFVSEPIDCYKIFKQNAKRCLRFYVGNGQKIVMPLEMLAILNDSEHLEKVYSNSSKSGQTVTLITKIFSMLHHRDVSQEGGKIKIGKGKISKLQIALVSIFSFVAIFAICFSSAIFATSSNIFGGNALISNLPTKIFSENQFLEAVAKESGNFVLSQDISLSNFSTVDSSSISVDGNGHTITLEKVPSVPLFNLFKGTIQNVNFVVDNKEITIEDNFCLIAKYNYGTISQVNFDFKANIVENTDKSDLYSSLYCYANVGLIINCNAKVEMNFDGDGDGNTYFTVFATANNGTMTNCVVGEKSSIKCDTVDVSAIATENLVEGKMNSCQNYADIIQKSNKDGWSPNVAGIVVSNSGKLNSCKNYGALSAISTANTQNILSVSTGGIAVSNLLTIENCINEGKIVAQATFVNGACKVYAGGVVVTNSGGTILKCKNSADISAISNIWHIYAGGICALSQFNESVSPMIDNCGSFGKIEVATKMDEKIYAMAGSIAGLANGNIKNCFASMTFISQNGESLFGGIVGVKSIKSVLIGSATNLLNNHYVSNSQTLYGAGGLLSYEIVDGKIVENLIGTTESNLGEANLGCSTVKSFEDLEKLEVFWK